MESELKHNQVGYILKRNADGQYATYDHGINCIQEAYVFFTKDIFVATQWEPRSELPPEMRELVKDKTAYTWLKVRHMIETFS